MAEKLPPRVFRRPKKGGILYWQGTVNGARKPISLKTKRWDLARERYNELEREFAAGKLPQRRKPDRALDVVYEEWLRLDVKRNRTEKGQKLARRRGDLYFLPHFRSMRPGEVTTSDLEEYRDFLGQKGLSPTTVNHILSDGRRLFNWLVRRGDLDRSPVPRDFIPQPDLLPIERLSDLELAICRKKLRDRQRWTFELYLQTGARWNEVAESRIGDVDFKNRCLVLRKTKSKKFRVVPLSGEMLAELRSRAAQYGGRLIHYSPGSVGAFNKAVRRQTKVHRFHAHLLRHTFARLYLERGGGVKQLQQILGHASVKTTERYAEMSPEAIRADWERVQNASENASVRVGSNG